MREIISNKDQKRSYTGNLSVYQIHQENRGIRNEVEKQRGRSTKKTKAIYPGK